MSRLLLFSDVHADLDACRSLVDRAPDADVVVGAGDFCRMRRHLQRPIDVLSAIDTPTVLDFYGLGGGVPITPFGAWSYDLSEGEAGDLLADCPEGAVLVSHSPPKGVVDRDSSGQSLGSTAVRDTIEEKRPALTVCGHIHGSWGQDDTLASTRVVNAGPSGLFWKVPDSEGQ